MNRANQSTGSQKIHDDISGEYFWGCELTKDKPTVTWSFQEEDNDEDFLQHTLFLKHAVLGSSATNMERNLIEVETSDFTGNNIKQPVFDLTLGQHSSCFLDLSFIGQIPVTFRLAEGSGPVCISGQHLVEFPEQFKEEQESMLQEITDDEDIENLSSAPEVATTSRKRKAQAIKPTKKQKLETNNGAQEAAEVNENEEDEDDDDDEDQDEEGEDEVDDDNEDFDDDDEDDGPEDDELDEEDEEDESDDDEAMEDDEDDVDQKPAKKITSAKTTNGRGKKQEKAKPVKVLKGKSKRK